MSSWHAPTEIAHVRIPYTLVAAGARLNALAYAGGESRDLRFDFLRGFAVVAMVVDHLAGPSALYLLTGGNRFFTSAAEAFVLISGVVTGQVYRRVAEREGLGVALVRLLRRARDLYLLTLGLTMLALSVGQARPASGEQVMAGTPLEFIWTIVTLHQTTYLVDVPLLYTLLLLFAPLALLLMREGRTWVVALGSLVLWGGHQLFAGEPDIPWPIAGNNLFHFAAWQVLFFMGMVLGYHRTHLQERISCLQQWSLLFASGAAFAALVVAFAFLRSGSDTAFQAEWSIALMLTERVFAKNDLQVGRLIASAIVLGFFFLLATRFWVPLRASLGWLLLPLGQNALYAYTAHTALALGLPLIALHAGVVMPESLTVNALVQVSGIALIWSAIRLRLLFPTAGARRRWMLIPTPLSAILLLFTYTPVPAANPSVLATLVAPDDPPTRLARVFGTPIPRQQVPDSAAEARMPRAALVRAGPRPVPSPTATSTSLAEVTPQKIHGTFREMSFYSAAFDRQMSYYVYLPAESNGQAGRYPVLYMLHGGSGSKDEWPTYGLIDAVDRLIASNEVSPLIVVLPQGDNGYWVNQANDGPRWGDYLTHDVIMNVDAALPTIADRDHRAIGGLSMGGAGALQIAFNHPELFRVVGAHSPSLHLDDGTFPILGTGADFAAREPLKLAAEAAGIEALDIWIDAGGQDPWIERDQMLHQALADRGIVHHWRVSNGGHEGQYWQRNLEQYLRSYDAALHEHGTSQPTATALD